MTKVTITKYARDGEDYEHKKFATYDEAEKFVKKFNKENEIHDYYDHPFHYVASIDQPRILELVK
jgi:hypothetical protein